MRTYTTTPGRGLNTSKAIELRKEYLHDLNISIKHLESTHLYPENINNNIESFIGSVEIPIGLVGPLLFKNDQKQTLLHAPVGTLEGALVASMNRGCKAISMSDGFEAEVLYQRMYRAPLLVFEHETEVEIVQKWIAQHFKEIKKIAESYSNHATLEKITCIPIENSLNLVFCFQTGDASGQNMTTTCTWHALQWIMEKIQIELSVVVKHSVIEGNASSDKKVSQFIAEHGRGMGVKAQCILQSEVIEHVLRTTAKAFLDTFIPSKKLAKQNGMVGYNINVANAIAGIFVATGQDLASIHESSIGHLHLEEHPMGLKIELTLPSLVIGTVGGGTHLVKQNEALRMMGCEGPGQIENFAIAIAGFALALEISTFAAIVSGEFAKAHEKLGRNKPVKYFQPDEITADFLNSSVPYFKNVGLLMAEAKSAMMDNGLLTNITKKAKSNKMMGFYPLELGYQTEQVSPPILLRAKALDSDVIQGLHHMAASVSPKLSDLIYAHRKTLEYKNTHLKESEIYTWLTEQGFTSFPTYYGSYHDDKTESHFVFQEYMDLQGMQLVDSENHPEKWTFTLVTKVLKELTAFQMTFLSNDYNTQIKSLSTFSLYSNRALYFELLDLAAKEEYDTTWKNRLNSMKEWLVDRTEIKADLTIVHNDFNPRNIAIRANGDVCIYDWELAIIGSPQRDWVEFICFVMSSESDINQAIELIDLQWDRWKDKTTLSKAEWRKEARIAIEEFMLGRLLFYKVAGILIQLKFINRVFENAWNLHEALG